jgi:hypothetical protein
MLSEAMKCHGRYDEAERKGAAPCTRARAHNSQLSEGRRPIIVMNVTGSSLPRLLTAVDAREPRVAVRAVERITGSPETTVVTVA